MLWVMVGFEKKRVLHSFREVNGSGVISRFVVVYKNTLRFTS